MKQAKGLTRGCGKRKKGGAYSFTALSEDGIPLRECILCPTIPVDMNEIGLGARGVLIHDGNIYDYVGESGYPFVPDFVEEGRRYGFSRRLELNDYSSLTASSRHILVHAKANITTFGRPLYVPEVTPWDPPCPKQFINHDRPEREEFCTSMLWEALPGKPGQLVQRDRPSMSYQGYGMEKGVEFETAAFLVLPITEIHVIAADDGSHMDKVKRISQQTNINVEVCNE